MQRFPTRCLINSFFAFLLLAPPALAQTAKDDPDAEVKEELRTLIRALNTAWQQRDRAALERIYAEAFVFVHALGYADDRGTQIDEMLAAEAVPTLPPPSFDPPNQLYVYDEVAVHRALGKTGLGTAAWITTLYIRKEGRWQIFQRQATELLPERTAVLLDPALLDTYVGRYDRGAGSFTLVARQGDTLFVHHPGYPKRKLLAASETQFFDKVGGEWTFERGPEGKVNHFVLRLRNGQEVRGHRVD